MKKCFYITFILCIVAALLGGCGKSQNKADENKIVEEKTSTIVDDIYMNVLKDEVKFTSEDGKELLFSEFVGDIGLKDIKISYALCDFDRDEENEMVINIRDMFYLILNYEDGIVYGFNDVYRGIEGLRVDGTYIGSGGADAHGIGRTIFFKNKRIDTTLAISDWGKYQIGGKSVSKEEYDEIYEKEYSSKELVKFTMYDEHYNK